MSATPPPAAPAVARAWSGPRSARCSPATGCAHASASRRRPAGVRDPAARHNQANDLVVYRTARLQMPRTCGRRYQHSRDMPITVTLRRQQGGAPSRGTSTSHAPMSQRVVYWSTSGMTYSQPKNGDTMLAGLRWATSPGCRARRTGAATDQDRAATSSEGEQPRAASAAAPRRPTARSSLTTTYPWNAVLASGKPSHVSDSRLPARGRNAITQPWMGLTTFWRALERRRPRHDRQPRHRDSDSVRIRSWPGSTWEAFGTCRPSSKAGVRRPTAHGVIRAAAAPS
jgi:hypothetical protein